MALALTPERLAAMPREQKEHVLALLAEKHRRATHRKLFEYYPDTGPLRRELYPKHLQFFRQGAQHEPGFGCPKGCDGSPHRERGVIAANRVGKTEGCGGYEVALHLTGRYPDWWEGYRFTHPIDAWCAGTTLKTTRDIQQLKLLGPSNDIGSGLIPLEDIVKYRPMSGVPDGIETVQIKHQAGGLSRLGFKSYDQGRKTFEGTEKHVVWLDEEPLRPIYEECMIRLMTMQGLMIVTFTPLEGWTPLVLEYIPEGVEVLA